MTETRRMSPEEKGRIGIFDGEAAQKGYALNKLCHTLNTEEGRQEFLADQEAYCDKFGLNEEQKQAVRSRKRDDFVMAGGSLYFFGKFIRLFPEAGEAFSYAATVKGHEGD